MSNPYQSDITQAWVLTLIQEYETIRAAIPAISKLRTPNFAISDRFSRKLGEWCESSRKITLSETLFLGGNWSDIIFTLKHEMAHQVVSDLFKIHNEKPHGAAFKRACLILEIDASACTQLSDLSNATENKIYGKIKKLLALGESSNKHEAEHALAKAHELSLKHNIQWLKSAKRSDYGIRLLGPLFGRAPSYIWGIMRILDEFYFVQYIYRSCGRNAAGNRTRPKKIIELYGRQKNLDLAEYVYYFLLHHGDAKWLAHKEDSGLKNGMSKISFLNGVYAGFYEKLESQAADLSKNKALIWLGDSQLDAFYRERNPYIRRRRSSSRLHAADHAAGVETGKKMQIRPGLGSQKNSTGRDRKLLI